ncbi:MAG TPA: vWA domain-containing protein [Gaiellaceae bacterium]|nr:vWA domain-containing protein [Gaiellaceae bacterium]
MLFAVVPLVALGMGARRVEAVRRALRLPPPDRSHNLRRAALLVLTVALLALAATQPVVHTRALLRTRTDAQVFIVLDTSRSMAAAPSPAGASRLARAERIAISLGAHLGDLPIGVATFTDRVLPDLFPTANRAAFDSSVSAVTIEAPPPREASTVATTFDALSALATQGFFPDGVHKRAVVVLTDGETAPFDPAAVASALAHHGVRLIVVRVGTGADRVWRPVASAEPAYRPNPAGARLAVASLEAAMGARHTADPAAFVRRAVGSGPSAQTGVEVRTRTLAPVPALMALVPLLLLLLPPSTRPHSYRLRAGQTTRRASA